MKQQKHDVASASASANTNTNTSFNAGGAGLQLRPLRMGRQSSRESSRKVAGRYQVESPEARGRPRLPRPGIGTSVSAEQLSLSFFHLRHLLQAGVGLSDALQEIGAMESAQRLKRVWSVVALQVQTGVSLSQAMAGWPGVFSDGIRALIRAGEINGDLTAALEDCCEQLDWLSRTRSSLLTAMVYPLVALCSLLLVIVFLMVSVIPSLSGFLAATQTELDWHSRWLLSVSAALQGFWLPCLLLFLMLSIFLLLARATVPAFRRFTDQLLLRLPLLGPIGTALGLSRQAVVCARLYRGGIELGQAMRVSETVIGNRALRQVFRRVRHAVTGGASLEQAMQHESLLPSSYRRLLGAGESTGALAQAMMQAAEQHQSQARHQMQRIERLLGPALLLLVGGLLLWIIVSLLGPVYEAAIDAVLLS